MSDDHRLDLDTLTIEQAKNALIEFAGRDCMKRYVFKELDDAEAFVWLLDVLGKITERRDVNADRAKRASMVLSRCVVAAYLGHIGVHEAFAKAEENQKLRETVDHLASKITVVH